MHCEITKTYKIEKSYFDIKTEDAVIWQCKMSAQISARPKSSPPFYEKLSTYVSLRVSDQNASKRIKKHQKASKDIKKTHKMMMSFMDSP